MSSIKRLMLRLRCMGIFHDLDRWTDDLHRSEASCFVYGRVHARCRRCGVRVWRDDYGLIETSGSLSNICGGDITRRVWRNEQ